MGQDSSKHKQYFKRKKQKNRYSAYSASSLCSDDSHCDWEQVGNVPFCYWKSGAGEVHGFDLFENWSFYHLKVQKKHSAFQVLNKTEGGKKNTKICSFTCEVEETGRQEKVGWWIKDMGVLAINSDVIVIQIVLSKAVKILAVNLHTKKLLGTYTFAYEREPCLQESYISPDSTVILVRQNFHERRRLGHVASFDSNIRILRITNGLCERITIVEDTLAFNCFGSGISFDPRFPAGRAVIISSSIQSINDPDSAVQLYDIPMRMAVLTTEACTDKVIHHIKHSPNGAFVAILCIDVVNFINIYSNSIQILSSDSLLTLNIISCGSDQPLKQIEARAFPAFSRNGRYLAQLHVDETCHVNVYQMPCTEHSLMYFCRSVILHYTPQNNVPNLPLPKQIINYLQFKENR